jgi:hypothetical protein
MGSHSFTGGPSHPARSLRYSDSDYYVIVNGRSGQPNSSRLSPVHVWWLSQALSSRATTVIAGLVPTIANCYRKCGSSRVLLAKTHCVKHGEGVVPSSSIDRACRGDSKSGLRIKWS